MSNYKCPIDQLVHTTVRIECQTPQGTSCGSGYFFDFMSDKGCIPCIVTNKHVVAGATTGNIHLTIKDNDGVPKLGEHEQINFQNFENLWISHPDPQIDLAIFPLAPLLQQAEQQNINFYRIALSKEIVATDMLLNTLSTMIEIIMIGYPNGLWDKKHNLPIIRRGITATHPRLSLNNKPEFMIDAACFPGSSGSPVFLANIGSFVNDKGAFCAGSRIAFVGTLYAGPQYSAKGEIEIVEVPTAQKSIAQSLIPINLGLVIQANKILDFESVLNKL